MKQRLKFAAGLMAAAIIYPSSASAIFVDGQGHYSLRGETLTHPGFGKGNGIYQGIEQNFRLNGELRASDKASFMMELRLFDDPRKAYLGDPAQPQECSPIENGQVANRGNATNCAGRNQSTNEPGYQSYMPRVTEAYAQFATDFCLLKAGRRGRDWGMGIFLNTDYDPFDASSSIFDGVSCDINIQKSQTLAFSFGYDKLQETGSPLTLDPPTEHTTYGATKPGDDLEQYFFTIQYDDRKANAGSPFTQQVGIYFANVVGGAEQKTDIKLADLFLSFFLQDLTIKQEVLFRLGKTTDPNFTRLGGSEIQDDDGDNVKSTNSVDSIAAAGSLEYYLSRSGSAIGPEEYRKGNATSHSLFLEYAYAPGDKDGYTDLRVANAPERTDRKAEAIALHRNFKPALILFNGKPGNDNLRVDGAFDPGRVMNAFVWGLGYRFKSMDSGNFELKVLGATMNEGMPGNIKAAYDAAAANEVAPGYAGKDIGYELDLKYDTFIAKGLQVGVAAGVALPGDAWKVYKDENPQTSALLQTFATFTF